MPRFAFACSYQGTVWFRVTDETGTYEAEFRRSVPDYEMATANGPDVRRDMVESVGILRRSHLSDADLAAWRADRSAPCFAVPQATVDAFNAWRAAERAAHIAQMQADPDRYGIVDPADPFIFPPILPARRGWYVAGKGWQSDESAALDAAA